MHPLETKRTTLTTPCRLHFGMFALGGQDRSYGGLGVMIDRPRVEVTITAADRLICSGSHADRALEIVRRWQANQICYAGKHSGSISERARESEIGERAESLKCRVDVRAPDQHIGLGVGTQMALAIGAALYAHFELPMPNVSELALSLGRGRRSAVGSFGFPLGGLIVDGGCEPDSSFPDLSGRFAVPADWRFVLVQPHLEHELFGESENTAFDRLPTVADETRNRLAAIAQDQLIPAVIAMDFDRFASSVGQFNRISGGLFAAVQGGPYNGRVLEQMVGEFEQAGFVGVGQSSWGPTLFVLAENEQRAAQAARLAREMIQSLGGEVSITRVDNDGFRLSSTSGKSLKA